VAITTWVRPSDQTCWRVKGLQMEAAAAKKILITEDVHLAISFQ
jgi:hypothetical protein